MKKPLIMFACVVLGIIVTTMVWPRRTIHNRVSKCVLNLERLQEDKRAWASEHHKTKGDIIAWSHLDGANDQGERIVTVLDIPPVESIITAVRASLWRTVRRERNEG
jgi:hypothetical protein